MGPLIPLFWTSGDVCPWIQSQGGSLFACFITCVILRFTSGVTPADCMEVRMQLSLFNPHTCRSVHKHWWRLGPGLDCIPLSHSGSAIYIVLMTDGLLPFRCIHKMKLLNKIHTLESLPQVLIYSLNY